MKTIVRHNIYSKRPIAIVGINGDKMAHKVVEELHKLYFKNVTELNGCKSYPELFTLSQLCPDFTLFIEDSDKLQIKSVTVNEFVTGKNMRPVKSNYKIKKIFRHYLRMTGLKPIVRGGYKIPFDDVKELPEDKYFVGNESPMLYIMTPDSDNAARAIAQSIKQYFLKLYPKLHEPEPEPECESCLYGSVKRG